VLLLGGKLRIFQIIVLRAGRWDGAAAEIVKFLGQNAHDLGNSTWEETFRKVSSPVGYLHCQIGLIAK